MSRFFVDEKNITKDMIIINDPQDVKHLVKVLRHKEGDQIEISDGKQFEYQMEIINRFPDYVEGRILSKQPFYREAKIKITLYQGIPKQGKMEVIVQKAVELGVHKIVPMFTERTVVMDKGGFTRKTERWQKVSDEAVKQCRRGRIPAVTEAQNLGAVLNQMKENQLNLFFYEEEKCITLKDVLRHSGEVETVGILIGPEGGFSEEEAEKIVSSGGVSVSMGKTVLRVETASAASIAMVMYEMEL